MELLLNIRSYKVSVIDNSFLKLILHLSESAFHMLIGYDKYVLALTNTKQQFLISISQKHNIKMWSLNLLGKKVTIIKYINFILWYFIDMPDSIPKLNTKKID